MARPRPPVETKARLRQGQRWRAWRRGATANREQRCDGTAAWCGLRRGSGGGSGAARRGRGLSRRSSSDGMGLATALHGEGTGSTTGAAVEARRGAGVVRWHGRGRARHGCGSDGAAWRRCRRGGGVGKGGGDGTGRGGLGEKGRERGTGQIDISELSASHYGVGAIVTGAELLA
ncbi:uncharacterized protein [Miscanthus floridulus]|uniref:uncharacterized protein n=1 Tax=Miscanthus floridulus TaxID=154761 RepID=UPI00345B1002